MKRNPIVAFIACIAIATSCGCLVNRGRDFGSWAGTGDNIPLVKLYNVDDQTIVKKTDSILLIPPIGAVDRNSSQILAATLFKEGSLAFNSRLIPARADGVLSDYMDPANIAPVDGVIDAQEVSRIGKLVDTPYVMAVWVHKMKTYPPQCINLYVVVVSTESGKAVAELEASFNAEEQRVVLALADYLQGRRSREYSKESLDIMMRSPTEFQGFVVSTCMRMLSDALK